MTQNFCQVRFYVYIYVGFFLLCYYKVFISLSFNIIDVIGFFTGLGVEREIQRNGTTTKLNIIELEADEYI